MPRLHLPSSLRAATFVFAVWALISEADAQSRRTQTSRPRPPQTSPTGAQFEALPLDRSSQNHLLVRALINGKPAVLGVDSGAPISAISINRRAYFGMTPISADGQIPTRLRINGAYNNVAVAHSLRLGSLNLVDEPMVAINLGGPSVAGRIPNSQEIDGILGADVLFPTMAVLDCQKQMLILKMDPSISGGVPGMDYRGFNAVPIHVSSGFNLYVDSTVNGTASKLMVDTGAFATLLHRPFVRSMNIPLQATQLRSAGVNLKQRGIQMAFIRQFSIGSFAMRGKEVAVTDLTGLIHGGLLEATPPVAGLLGAEILRTHHGIIDFGTRTLYLKR